MARFPNITLPFNPDVLKWARRLGNYSLEEAGKALNVPSSKIDEWEKKDSIPTVRQARLLADFYKRPFLEFFSETVPQLQKPQLVPDFRMTRDKATPSSERTLTEIQEWAESQRLNAIDLFEITGEEVPQFPCSLYATENDDPESIAARVRKAVGFSIKVQLSLRGNEKQNLSKILRKTLEDNGILIFKDSMLRECNARGLCVFFEILPVIVISSESPAGSAFTIVHELGHIILKQSAVSGTVIPKNTKQAIAKIETWCNRFASAFLMPSEAIRQMVSFNKMVAEISDEELGNYARKLSVSQHAMLVRLVQLGLVNEKYYWDIKRPQFLIEESKFKAGGRSKYYGSRYRNHNGDLYTSLVLEAWSSRKITNHNAAEFMGIKNLTHLYDIRKHFYAE